MTVPTSTELTLLRSKPQGTKLWLSIYQPPTVLACQVSGTHAKGSYVITYDSVTSGNYLLIESGMTMYVGSTLGGKDRGRIRVRSATATTITVAENTDINWLDNSYLTVVRFFEIWPVFPRIISDSGHPENTLWYKDYDIVYTNQNTVLGSFVNMGCHHAAFLEGGQALIYYSASGSFNLKSEAMSYNWWFQGATVTGSTSQTPGNITYTSPGHYTTRLTVTTSGSASDVSYRHISVYDRPENGTSIPPLKWGLSSFTGDRDAGGYTSRVWVREDTSSVVDGALVVIFADDFYDTSNQSIGGNALGRQKIIFVGYILDGSINYDYQDSMVEFDVGSPSEIMKLAEGFSIAVNSSSDPAGDAASDDNIPSAWALLLNMDCRRAIYHYLRWQSTFLMTNDIEFVGTDYNIQYFDADRESLYDGVNTLMMSTLVGETVCDRQGKLWLEVSAAALGATATGFPLNMTLIKQDWMGRPEINEIQSNQLSFLEMGGIYFPGPGNDSSAFLSNAPGTTPAYRGRIDNRPGLALASQAQLNTLTGHVFAWDNAHYPDVAIDLVGNYRNLDIAPQERIGLTVALDDTRRGIAWTDKEFVLRGMNWSYDPTLGVFLPSISLHELVDGTAGQTITIPDIPPSSGFDIPPIDVPPFDVPTPIFSTGTSGGAILATSLYGMVIPTQLNGQWTTNLVSFSTEHYDDLSAHAGVGSTVTFVLTGRYEFSLWVNVLGVVSPDAGASWGVTAENQIGVGITILPIGFTLPDNSYIASNLSTLYPAIQFNNKILASAAMNFGVSITAGATLSARVLFFIKDNTIFADATPALNCHVYMQIRKV